MAQPSTVDTLNLCKRRVVTCHRFGAAAFAVWVLVMIAKIVIASFPG